MIGFQIGCLILVTTTTVIATEEVGYSIPSSTRLPLCLLATMAFSRPTVLVTGPTIRTTVATMDAGVGGVADLPLVLQEGPARQLEANLKTRRFNNARHLPPGRLLLPVRE